MGKYGFILLLLIKTYSLQAQPVFSDSLRLALYNSPVDTNHVKNVLTAILYLPYSQPDSALHYAESTLKVSQQLNYDRGIAYSYQVIAECFILKGDYSKAIFYIYQHLNLFNILGDMAAINRANYQLAEIYAELGEFRMALDYKLQVKENLNAPGFNQINDWYATEDPGMWFHDYNLADAYLNAQMLDSALKYGERAIVANNRWSVIPILMGDIFLMKKDYTNALKYYNTRTSENYPLDSVKNFIGKAKAFKQFQQQDSSRIFALKALDIARRLNYAKGILFASELLSSYYEERDPYESLEYLKMSNAVRDSLYNKGRINQVNSIAFNDELRKLDAIAAEKAARNRIKVWSLIGVMGTLLITGFLLWRNNQHKKRANTILQKEKKIVEQTLEKLKTTQTQLIQSEKMASLGELTAGIAHEIQNPLNFVNNFSEVNKELVDELEQEADNGNLDEVRAIAKDIKDNEEKINHHGKRADAIVKGMLQHSRSSSGVKELTDINALADEYLRLAYHGLRAKEKSFNATMKTDFDESIGRINIIPQDIGRVILNLINNAFYAVDEKKKHQPPSPKGEKEDSSFVYEPVVTITTKRLGPPLGDGGKPDSYRVEIRVADNGNGIPQKVLDKIFQPFFTTKPTGQGTGLGLSLSYDIVKAHGGELNVNTKEEAGSEFIIQLPVSKTSEL